MKKKLHLFLLISLFSSSIFASFPVNKDVVTEKNITVNILELEKENFTPDLNLTVAPEEAISPAIASASNGGGLDPMWIALILWFFLGLLAAHRWYAKKPTGWNILFILTLGGLGIWALVDLINILTGSFTEDM